MENFVNWFEIPALDFDRAVKFYSTVLGVNITANEFMGAQMGFFPSDGTNVSGAIITGSNYSPANGGVLLYLNGGADLSVPLGKVEAAGGKIIVPKTQISDDMGYFAIFNDTEGNTMAFHSMS
ncbi:VOC family protein [Oscillatoria amoena NRMC-F 0135]|nr:VOC family protein [Oscillatoria amoena NRMC-F 0135]